MDKLRNCNILRFLPTKQLGLEEGINCVFRVNKD